MPSLSKDSQNSFNQFSIQKKKKKNQKKKKKKKTIKKKTRNDM